MLDYEINHKTGAVDQQSELNLARYKLYPYVLFACGCLGSCATLLWTISGGKISAHLEYITDGVEEAVGELMQGIQMTKKFKNALEEEQVPEAKKSPKTPKSTPNNSNRNCELIFHNL